MNIPRPEYPRPRLVRDDWMNLNGEWQFEIDATNTGHEKGFVNRTEFKDKITVPFAPESKLSGIEFVDFMAAVWYRRTFTLPENMKGRRVILHFGAVDYEAKVYVNGKYAGGHMGGYTPFSFDITGFVTDGENSVTLYARDNTCDRLQPSGKQSNNYHNYGCLYTRTTGIWQTVWIEFVPNVYVTKLKLTPDIDMGKIDVEMQLSGYVCANAEVEISFEGKTVASYVYPVAGKSLIFGAAVPDFRLWSVDEPNLYDIKVKIGEDEVTSYFGMRKVTLHDGAIEINGKKVFQRLVLDQGFYPDGIYTAPTDEDLKRDIELSKKIGFNGARLHMKVFEPRTSYWADKLGYLLWGEYPNWGLSDSLPEALTVMLPEWLEAVERDYNSPAIIGWCPFNETSDCRCKRMFETVYNVTHAIDPMRPVIDTSGYTHVITDVYDVHDYDQNPESFKERYIPNETGEGKVFVNDSNNETYRGQPYFVSEFGGTFWDIDNIKGSGWGYGESPKELEEFYTRFEGLVTALLDNKGICAFCYTQFTDLMQEKNGMYAFDRREKFDCERIREILTRPAAIEK